MLEKPVKLRGDLICLSDLGGDPKAILAGSGVCYETILGNEPLPRETIAHLLDLLALRAPRDFSITGSRAIRVHHLGMLGYRLSNCGTVGDLLRDWVPYSQVIDYPLSSTFQVDADRWRMEFRPRYALPEAAHVYCFESTLAGFRRSVSNMSGIELTLNRSGLPFAVPRDAPDYEQIGAAALHFDADCGYVEGCSSELALAIEAADPEVLRVCDAHCRAELLRHRAGSYVERIEGLLSSLPTLTGLSEVARMLGESPRSVQRKLAGDGASFADLLDTARRERALQLLRRKVPTKVIAFQLGFKDVGSFRRAFRCWTGCTPSEWDSASASLPEDAVG